MHCRQVQSTLVTEPVLEGQRWRWTSSECSLARCTCSQFPWCRLTTRRCGWYGGGDWLLRWRGHATPSLMQTSVTRSCSSSTWWSRRRACSPSESSSLSAVTAPSSASQSRQSAVAALTVPRSPCPGWCHGFLTVSATRRWHCTVTTKQAELDHWVTSNDIITNITHYPSSVTLMLWYCDGWQQWYPVVCKALVLRPDLLWQWAGWTNIDSNSSSSSRSSSAIHYTKNTCQKQQNVTTDHTK